MTDNMLSPDNELEVIKQLVISDSILAYEKQERKYVITIKVSPTIELTIVDDLVIDCIPPIMIHFENNTDIEELNIKIHSGYQHNPGHTIGLELMQDHFYSAESPTVTLESHNNIKKLTVCQEMGTEDIYSYYGNQDGFSPCQIIIKYDSEYKEVICDGQIKLSATKDVNDGYSLIISI